MDKNTEKHVRISILATIIDYCNQNNLDYFVGFGSMLGAVRENRMIEWDYDIDVLMPKPDFELFVHGFNTVNGRFRVLENSITPNFVSRLAIVQDMNTYNITKPEMSKINPLKRICVEIYPIDGVPKNSVLRWIRFTKTRILGEMLKISQSDTSINRGIIKNSLIRIGKFFVRQSPNTIVGKLKKLTAKNDYNLCEYTSVYIHGGPYPEKTLFPKSIYLNYTVMDFERLKVRVPLEYDRWLKQVYGDYMVPPSDSEKKKSIRLRDTYDYDFISQ